MLEVTPEADDELLAAWEGTPGATLYRALRPDAQFRFVAVAEGDAASVLPFAAQAGAYEVVHEDGTPDGDEGVTLVNPFRSPPRPTSPSWPAGAVHATCWPASRATSGRGCTAATRRPSASSTSPAGRAR